MMACCCLRACESSLMRQVDDVGRLTMSGVTGVKLPEESRRQRPFGEEGGVVEKFSDSFWYVD